jgi:aspartyl-tRNA(Asn)/glutamyl-tRNA(Gln) amidotransferase subunit B
LTLDNGHLIRINRAHQEEDTAKLVHQFGTQESSASWRIKSQNKTLIDFNRSGVPLVEIVTEPDFRDVDEIRDYAKKLQQVFRYLGVSGADMERGDMRLEANISVRPVGQKDLPNYRVELKNINSFRFMVDAVEFEIKRQITALESGEELSQETRGWDEEQKSTYLQRSKENANDYRYFPEPDLPEMRIDELRIKNLESSLPELPWDKTKRYEKEFGIKRIDARILAESIEMARFFETSVEEGRRSGISPQDIANYLINKKIDISKDAPDMVVEKIKSRDAGVIEDIGEIEKWAKQAIEENQKSASDYISGKENAIQSLIGGVMRLSKGKADVSKLKAILENQLKN